MQRHNRVDTGALRGLVHPTRTQMNFDERRKRAIAVLNRKGIPQASSEPVQIRLFRRLGFQVRPLHFETFWRTTLFFGLWFGPFWAVIMWFFSWRKDGTDPMMAVLAAAICGLVYGMTMAGVFAWNKKKHALPTWESLGS